MKFISVLKVSYLKTEATAVLSRLFVSAHCHDRSSTDTHVSGLVQSKAGFLQGSLYLVCMHLSFML